MVVAVGSPPRNDQKKSDDANAENKSVRTVLRYCGNRSYEHRLGEKKRTEDEPKQLDMMLDKLDSAAVLLIRGLLGV